MPHPPFPTVVSSFRPLSPTSLEIVLQKPLGFDFHAGQYIEIALPSEPSQRWPFSLASAPEDPGLHLCIRTSSDLAPFLDLLPTLPSLLLFGPSGSFRYETPADRHAIILAAGTGISPFRSMLRSAHFRQNPPRSLRLFLGVPSPDEILYSDEPWTAIPSLSFLPVFSRSSPPSAFLGRLPAFLQAHPDIASQPDTDFYLCGPSAMIASCKAILLAHHQPHSALFQERW